VTPPPISYAEAAPEPELAPWLACWWTFRVAPGVPPFEHHVPLTGSLLLAAADGSPLFLAGPRVTPLTVPAAGGQLSWGVIFHPGAARSLLGLPEGSLRDERGPVARWLGEEWEEGWPGDSAQAVKRLRRLLRQRAVDAPAPDPVVRRAVGRLRESGGVLPVGELAAEVGVSPRQLRRGFARDVGLSPKELARVLRLRASATRAVFGDSPWSDVAAGGGYADQAHLIHEFRNLLGLTPGAFEERFRGIEHRLVDETSPA
jgi:AraC-like DNA-binding protein